VLLGIVWAAWHFEIFLHTVSADALFFASAVALGILMTVLFLHTRRSVLLAIVMHGSVLPGRDIAQALFPTANQPPDWLRALVAIAIAGIIVAITRGSLASAQKQAALRYAES
jgi:ABC-type glucose/galactose transport system permease subunit